jgi:hypothetical protein
VFWGADVPTDNAVRVGDNVSFVDDVAIASGHADAIGTNGASAASRAQAQLEDVAELNVRNAGAVEMRRAADPGGCFVRGTLVHTERGLIPIEQVQIGDMVWSQPEVTGDRAFRPVVRLLRFQDKAIWSISYGRSDAEHESVLATPNHPFWVKGVGWTRADVLQPGMIVELLDGEDAVVSECRDTGVRQDVFNFEVESFHTYYVGAAGVWVHNANCGGEGANNVRGYISGDKGEIRSKLLAAKRVGTSAERPGDVQALGEIQVAKILRSEGKNVFFQKPVGPRGSDTADFLVGGERRTGFGGIPTDVLTPRTANPRNVLLSIADKNDQAPSIIVNLSNNPSVWASQLGDFGNILDRVWEILEPQGVPLNIKQLRIVDSKK